MLTLAILGCSDAILGCSDRSTSPAAGVFKPKRAGVLTVVTSEVPTAGFFEGTPEHPTGGFEYELARAFATRFGLKSVRVVVVPFHRVVSGNLGGADIGLDLITPTSQRKKVLDFSIPYLNSPPAVLVRRDTSIPDLQTAQSFRWGAIRSTTFVDDIEDLVHPHTATKIFRNNGEVVNALRSGVIDATMFDLPLAVVLANRSGHTLKAAAQLPTPESIAAALPKGSSNTDALDSAIRAFTSDGTIQRLLKRWVGSAAANADTAIPLLHTTRD